MIPGWVWLMPLSIIATEAKTLNLDPKIMTALFWVESSGVACTTRYEPAYRNLHFYREHAGNLGITHETEKVHQKTSWGIAQIMGGTARELGFDGHLPELCDPRKSIHYGALYFKKKYEKYGDYQDAIAAYNAGVAKKSKGGLYLPGIVQKHVDKVMRHYRQLVKVK